MCVDPKKWWLAAHDLTSRDHWRARLGSRSQGMKQGRRLVMGRKRGVGAVVMPPSTSSKARYGLWAAAGNGLLN